MNQPQDNNSESVSLAEVSVVATTGLVENPIEVIYERICKEAQINPEHGVEFYQFVQAVLSFAANTENYAEYFASLSTSDSKQSRLKQVMLRGIEIMYNNKPSYRNFVSELFTTGTSVGEASQLVLMLMKLVQDASVHGKIEGQQKSAFVRQSVRTVLIFSDLSNDDQMLIMASVDLLIMSFVMVKHGALGAKAEQIAKNCRCCTLM